MKLIVGLGNPGSKYARTRHNAGVWAIEAIVEKYGFSAWVKKFDGLWCEGKIGEQKIAALLPQTFMNLSGQSVRAAQAKERIELRDIIVFHDELDVPAGKVKAKIGGGAGGHNGLKSIDALMGKDYARIRIGIGHPGNPDAVSDYVLSPPPPDERDAIQKVIDALALKFDALLGEKTDIAVYMNQVGLVLNPPKITPHPSLPPQGGKGQQRLLPPQESKELRNSSPPPLTGETGSLTPSPLAGEGRGGGKTSSAYPLKHFARSLRTNMTLHERMLWRHIRNEQLGVKFRRQQPMDHYIVDFVCLEKKLIIELDGGQHFDDKTKEKDDKRRVYLEKTGHQIIRFSNRDISQNMEGVLQTIVNALNTPNSNS